MKELNLIIHTNRDNESSVTMTAKFDTHMEAVAFHEGVSQLCRQHSYQKDGKIAVPNNILQAKGYAGKLAWLSGDR